MLSRQSVLCCVGKVELVVMPVARAASAQILRRIVSPNFITI